MQLVADVPLSRTPSVYYIVHMGESVRDRYLKALNLVNITELARETGRARSTLHAYAAGDRRVTAAAAREMATYLQDRSEELADAASEIEAALAQEASDG